MKRRLCDTRSILMVVMLMLLLSGQATAVKADPVIAVPGLGITVVGAANRVGGVWQYRYTITETTGIAVNQLEFIISEDAAHAGLHHENGFLNAAGVFRYDLVVPPAFLGIAKDNYFWSNLLLPANGVLTVGFDDIHGPAMAVWGIQAPGRGVNVDRVNLLPVPSSIPEPATLLLLGTGVTGLAIKMRKRFKSR